jgi:hypothetical protein
MDAFKTTTKICGSFFLFKHSPLLQVKDTGIGIPKDRTWKIKTGIAVFHHWQRDHCIVKKKSVY